MKTMDAKMLAQVLGWPLEMAEIEVRAIGRAPYGRAYRTDVLRYHYPRAYWAWRRGVDLDVIWDRLGKDKGWPLTTQEMVRASCVVETKQVRTLDEYWAQNGYPPTPARMVV